MHERVEKGRSAQRDVAREPEDPPGRDPGVAQVLALQRSAGNQAVSRRLQRSARSLARMKVLGAKDTTPREVQTLPPGFWFKCEHPKTKDVVWVFSDEYENLERLLPEYEWKGEQEFVDEPKKVEDEGPRSGYVFGEKTSGDKGDIGLGDNYDDSHLIHFGKAVKGQMKTKEKDKATIDPTKDTPDPAVTVENLTGAYPGTITNVHYFVPTGARTHWEIMCDAEKAAMPAKKEFRIKFDFTASGYRMIYKASASSLQLRKSVPVNVTVQDAMRMFREVATQGGTYEDGSNNCGTFARRFFALMTGQEAEAIEAKKETKKTEPKNIVEGAGQSKQPGSEFDAFL